MSSTDLLSSTESLLSEWWLIPTQCESLLAALNDLKKATDDSQVKNKIWGYQTLLESHTLYLKIFKLLKSEEFYKAWCKLERLEILLADLRENQEHISSDFGQSFLNNAVNSWQILYPYKLFSSSREIIKKISCSICQSPRSVLRGCRHRRRKLYAGELCYDVVEDFELITFDIVPNPVVKAAVLMNPQSDHYDYSLLKAALKIAITPRDCFTAFKINVPLAKHSGINSPTSTCPCKRSIRTYEDCCISRPTIETNHFIFDVLSPRRVFKGMMNDTLA